MPCGPVWCVTSVEPSSRVGLALHIVDRFDHFDAAGFAAAAGVDLRLHHPDRPAEFVGGLLRFVDAERRQCRAAPARRIRATPPSPGIRGCSWRSPSVFRCDHPEVRASEPRRMRPRCPGCRPSRAASRPPQGDGSFYLPRSGAIFLQASTRPSTAWTDFSNMARSAPLSSISTTRSTPLPPITTGTPT